MTTALERLGPGDFPAVVAFLDAVFGEARPHDFARMLPARYRPTAAHMRHQLAARDGPRILGLLGLFPLRWHLGTRSLSIGGVGGVGVACEHRGRGLMGRLLDRATALAREEGCALLWLAGQRQRYLRHGFERAGTEVTLTVTPRNLRGHAPPRVLLRPLADDEALPDGLVALAEREPWRCERAPGDLAAYLRSWHHVPLLGLTADGELLGYLAAHPETGVVHELGAASPEHRLALAAAWVASRDRSTAFVAATPFDPLVAALAPLAEQIAVAASGNWRILEHARVLDAILGAVSERTPGTLKPGEVTLAVAETGERLRLWVDGERAGCEASAATPALTLPAPLLLRTLFGPLPARATTALPRAAALLDAWCPLPLGLPRQDHV